MEGLCTRTDESRLRQVERSPLADHDALAPPRLAERWQALGLDHREGRYLAFVLTYRHLTNEYPDYRQWCLLVGGHYDRSGISLVGFDKFGNFGHHGWMKNFKAKMSGGRYVAFAPRKHINAETELLERPRRGSRNKATHDAGTD